MKKKTPRNTVHFAVLLVVVASCFAQCRAFAPSRTIQPSIVLSRYPIALSLAQDQNDTEGTSEEKRKQRYIASLNRAREFVVSVMKDVEEIPGSDGMRILRQIPSLDFIGRYDLVIRSITQPFWEECIRVVTTPGMHFRVCAVGTPGIGKTSSTPFLIRMLLKEKHTVVYRRLSAAYFWEFAWNNEEGYVVRVHPKIRDISDVDCLNDPSTFYIVDPGSTRNNCAPDTEFEARTIIVSSPNDHNWGSADFEKQRGPVIGMFRYFPIWSWKEILKARPYLSSSDLSEEEVTERFRQVGGVPRHVFLPKAAFDLCLQSQNDAVRALTSTQAQLIVEGNCDAVGSFGSNQPKSALIGYAPTQEKIAFSSRYVTFISQSVAETIAEKFIGELWNLMLQKDNSDWSIFEVYCRKLMVLPARSFLRRPCCGKKDPQRKNEANVTLGGCTAIRMGSDIAEAVITSGPMTLFHSVDPNYPLIDFIYKDHEGTVHAFQPTVGQTHEAKAKQMRELRKKLGDLSLALYYLIPGENFRLFVTKPTNPKTDELTQVWHILIPNPNKESYLRRPP